MPTTVKSTNITGIETAPRTYLDKLAGVKKVMVDSVSVATTSLDEIGDVILCGVVPSNAKITSISIFNSAMDSNGTPTLATNVGLYYSGKGTQAGAGLTSGTAVSASCFAAGITTLRSANKSGTEIRLTAPAVTSITQEAWQVAGLSQDPGGEFYIGFAHSAAAATAAAGTLAVRIHYFI